MERAENYGRRSVINLRYKEDDFDIVTQNQKDILFPLLKERLRGGEEILLDFGCGPGRFTSDLAHIIAGKAVGVDPVQAFLEMPPKCHQVEYRIMREGSIPLPDESVDVVWVCLVLGGIRGIILDRTTAEITRVLKDDGLLFLVENTSKNLKSPNWFYRSCAEYTQMFPSIDLLRIGHYNEIDEEISIMTGRKRTGSITRSSLNRCLSKMGSDGGFRPFFIVGCDRSGTTLLRLMLNQHSNIDIPDESDFVAYMIESDAEDIDLENDEVLGNFLDELFAIKRLNDWKIDGDEVRRRIFSSERSIHGVIRSVFEFHMEKNHKKRWGDKTPRYTRYIEDIHRIFPQALFIHIVRDGRDVAISLKKAEWFSDKIVEIANHWKSMVTSGMHAASFLETKYLEIYYEELVKDPERVLGRVCIFLGENFEEGMLGYWKNADVTFNEMWRGDHELLRGKVTTGRIGRWEHELSESEKFVFEFIAGNELEQLGYRRARRSRIGHIMIGLGILWKQYIIGICKGFIGK